MIRVAICEDDFVHRDKLKEFLEKILANEEYKLYSFSSGEELLKNYPENLDILLLDIYMKNINGIESAKEIRKIDDKVEIIFTTSSIEYAPQGYEVRAYRYLVKPIEYNVLNQYIIECKNLIKRKTNDYISIKSRTDIIRIPVSSIDYIEKISRNIVIYTDIKNYTSRMNIGDIEKMLEKHNFFRCHTGYLINLDKVKMVTMNDVFINNKVLPVSRQKIKQLKLLIIDSVGELI